MPALVGEMGWESSSDRRKLKMFKFRNHMIKMDSSLFPKKVFNCVLSINKKNWSSNIVIIFDDLDLLSICMNQNRLYMSNNSSKTEAYGNSIIKW